MWVVNKGTNLIMRFNPIGHITMVPGRRPEVPEEHEWISTSAVRSGKIMPPPAVPGLFSQPTDIAWDREGNMYISDGYINSRVAKYSKDGDWIKSWGTRGTDPLLRRPFSIFETLSNGHGEPIGRTTRRVSHSFGTCSPCSLGSTPRSSAASTLTSAPISSRSCEPPVMCGSR